MGKEAIQEVLATRCMGREAIQEKSWLQGPW